MNHSLQTHTRCQTSCLKVASFSGPAVSQSVWCVEWQISFVSAGINLNKAGVNKKNNHCHHMELHMERIIWQQVQESEVKLYKERKHTVRSLGRNCERGKSGTDQFEMFEVLQKSAFLYCYCLYWTHPPKMFYLCCGVTGYMMFAIWPKKLPCFFNIYVLVSDCDIFTCSSSLWPRGGSKHSFSLLMSVFLSV